MYVTDPNAGDWVFSTNSFWVAAPTVEITKPASLTIKQGGTLTVKGEYWRAGDGPDLGFWVTNEAEDQFVDSNCRATPTIDFGGNFTCVLKVNVIVQPGGPYLIYAVDTYTGEAAYSTNAFTVT